MPSPEDLRATLRELADSAPDTPDMPLTRSAPRHHALSTVPVLLVAGLLGVVLTLGVGASRHEALPLDPSDGPTQAVPPVATPSAAPTPTEATATPTPAPGGEASTRPMSAVEVDAQVESCLRRGLEERRRGELDVRYAMVQPALGLPSDGSPRRALLLEDAGGYFDCSGDHPTYTSKGGDDVELDPSAAGVELPTISGSSTSRCGPPSSSARTDAALALRTTDEAREARVTLRVGEGTRTATTPTRDGFVYVATQVSGEAAEEASTITVELLDARGGRLPVQAYAGPLDDRLTYSLDPCPGG